jgi:hypothetical protein
MELRVLSEQKPTVKQYMYEVRRGQAPYLWRFKLWKSLTLVVGFINLVGVVAGVERQRLAQSIELNCRFHPPNHGVLNKS